MQEKKITNQVSFTEYDFVAVCKALQPYLKEGFEFELENNDTYPRQFGPLYLFTLQQYELQDLPDVKPAEEIEELKQSVTVQSSQPTTRRARLNSDK